MVCPQWRDRWSKEEKLTSGGQGRAYRARRTADGQEAFLKVIKQNKDRERRARFFREAAAYDTIRADGVPRLIESNAHRHSDSTVKPYIATEFISGDTLSNWRDGCKTVDLEVAAELARSLLQTLAKCHAAEIVHRDIKPDNIILLENDPRRPRLLDFGLSYHPQLEDSFATADGQEIGNRLLRLPELAAGSIRKKDPRSDLSFVAGVLFYVLTGRFPHVLEDEEGRRPHQRHDVPQILKEAVHPRLGAVLSLFDDAFETMIENRISTVAEMIERLDQLMKPNPVHGDGPEANLKAIQARMDTEARQRQAARAERLKCALDQFRRPFEATTEMIDRPLDPFQAHRTNAAENSGTTLGWRLPGSSSALLRVRCEVREVGSELVCSLAGEPIHRTSVGSPRYGDRFDEKVRDWFLSRLREALDDAR